MTPRKGTERAAQAGLHRTVEHLRGELALRNRRVHELEKSLREMTREVGSYLESVRGDPDLDEHNAGLWERYERARAVLLREREGKR